MKMSAEDHKTFSHKNRFLLHCIAIQRMRKAFDKVSFNGANRPFFLFGHLVRRAEWSTDDARWTVDAEASKPAMYTEPGSRLAAFM